MATTTHDQLARPQFDRRTTEDEPLRDQLSLRTISILLLAAVILLSLVAGLAIAGLTYRPYRGC